MSFKNIDLFPDNPQHGQEVRFDYPEIGSRSIWRFDGPTETWEFVDMYRYDYAARKAWFSSVAQPLGGREPAKVGVGLAHASRGNPPASTQQFCEDEWNFDDSYPANGTD